MIARLVLAACLMAFCTGVFQTPRVSAQDEAIRALVGQPIEYGELTFTDSSTVQSLSTSYQSEELTEAADAVFHGALLTFQKNGDFSYRSSRTSDTLHGKWKPQRQGVVAQAHGTFGLVSQRLTLRMHDEPPGVMVDLIFDSSTIGLDNREVYHFEATAWLLDPDKLIRA